MCPSCGVTTERSGHRDGRAKVGCASMDGNAAHPALSKSWGGRPWESLTVPPTTSRRWLCLPSTLAHPEKLELLVKVAVLRLTEPSNPHLEYGTTYYPLRPTKLDKIKNLPIEVCSEPVAGLLSCHIGGNPPRTDGAGQPVTEAESRGP